MKNVFVAVLLWAGVSALWAKETKDFHVEGIVRAPVQEGSILIEHETIADYMPAMTMPFAVLDAKEVAELRPGDRVKFVLHVSDEKVVAGDFKKVGRVAAVAPARNPRRLKEGDELPPFSLTDQDGTQRSREDYAGKQVVLTFVFTRCPVPNFCPLISQHFADLQAKILADPQLKERVCLVSVTIDPENDDPKALRAYGTAHGANFRSWNFLTGSKDDIVKLQKAFSIFAQPTNGTIDHTLCTALISAEGKVVALWRGTGWETAEVMAALKKGLSEERSR